VGRLRADFSGDVALVTGSSSGIGLSVTRALCAAGARVHGFDVKGPVEPLQARAGRFELHELDLRDGRAVEQAVARVLAEEGRVDHLVGCAGLTRDRALWNLEEAEWQEVLDVNLGGAWRVLRAVAPAMRAAGRGRVVHLASINGLRGRFGQANYSASKAGLIALTRTAARELGPSGVTVNAIAPGMIESPMTLELPEPIRERARQESALGRIGRPEDVVAAVLFLLSDEAAHVTGAVLVVDGGQTA
jgi:acetoacetyl-CoA reductase/3-oxoacyl-[acyl-carrier protein] reductase